MTAREAAFSIYFVEKMEKHQKNIIEELKITADLARLEMHEDELKKAEGAFLEMIEYFSEMEAAEELLAEHSKAEAWDGGRGEAAWEHFRPDTARAAAANAADGS